LEKREFNDAELTPQQADRLFELFLGCREMDGSARERWLQEACGGNELLQRGVERLIREDASAEGFLSRPMRLVADAFPFTIQQGQRFGRYTIQSFVGRGGMGEVWKAHDEELDRAVALKFLHPGLAVNHLTREARMASALNHPAIVTVHDVAVWDGTPVLVMELVIGTPLSRVCDGRMPLHHMISAAGQIANALTAAHAEGIVHGDLKPDNIIWREGHFPKILDFGLSRRVVGMAPVLAGTPLYMSPEQARGEAIGTASDVYSLGLILFELTTGQRPFGRQALEDIGARRAKPPKASGVRSRLPQEFERLMERMLEPDPARRISMREAAEVLGRLERPPTPKRIWLASGLAAALTLAAALLVALWLYPGVLPQLLGGWRDQVGLSRLTIRPMASQPGLEDNPSMSPDGLWISCLYRARASDRPKLQVHSTKDGPPIVIDTGDLVVQGPAAWSPGSDELIFSALENSQAHGLYRVQRTGGHPRRIHGCRQRTDDGCGVDWSPDGVHLAIADRWPSNSELYILDLKSGERRYIVEHEKNYVTKPRFSPDGKWVAYLKEPSMASYDLYVAPTAGGKSRRITRIPWYLKEYGWSADAKNFLILSTQENNKPQIWQISLDGNDRHSVGALDGDRGSGFTFSRKKGSFAWVRNLNVNSLWRMSAVNLNSAAELLVNSAAVDVDAEWSHSGRMVFRSDRSGVNELWVANVDGSNPWQATHYRGPFVGDAHWSPDSRSIAFSSHVSGNPDIYVMRCEEGATTCGKPRQLTRDPGPDANPTWSRDGRWIYFSSSRSGQFEVWRMPADGRPDKAEQITWTGGYMARESQDGKWLYYSNLWPTASFWRIGLPLRGRGQRALPVALGLPFRAGATWALGTHELFYYPSTADRTIPFPSVRAVDLQSGRTRDLPLGMVSLGRGIALSPDEQWLLRSQNERASTLIMLAE
jgi:eukaryotic-like serine/threonine-protein kinase